MSGIIANTSDVSWVAESGDCINRQDAINVAIQAADDWDGGYNPERAEMIERGLKMLPALQAESCEDCISRQTLLNSIAEPMNWTDSEAEIQEQRDYDSFVALVKSMPSVTPKAGWIPVGKKMPEPNRLVLCYITTGATKTYFLAFWNDIQNDWEEGIGGCRLLKNDLGYEVIAWMPLPEPYEKNNKVQKS